MQQIKAFLFFINIGLAIAVPTRYVPQDKYEEGDRYFWFPDGNGKLHLVDLEEPEMRVQRASPNSVSYLLHTSWNPKYAQVIQTGDSAALDLFFDKRKPTKIIIHGWMSDYTSAVNTLIVDAYLKHHDVNVIIVDWGSAAGGLYSTGVSNVPIVGQLVANLVDWLIHEGTPVSRFHLMGHSLGGHVAAIAARLVKGGKIPVVTAFDPANPLWGEKSGRICPTDAEYVEVIHTNAGNLGLREPVGGNDFYPNGGARQPGCSFFSIGCSHSRSYEFFADSLTWGGYTATQCKDYKEMEAGKCSKLSTIKMGGELVKSSIGVFYLETRDKMPYIKE